MADTLRNIGAQMANVMFNLAQRPGDALTGDLVAKMDSLRKQWDAAVRATPPSPSTAPGHSQFANRENASAFKAPFNAVDERAAFERHERESNLRRVGVERDGSGGWYENPCVQSAWEGWQARAALASRPAEVDDEGLPAVLFDGHAVYSEITRKLGKAHCHSHEAVSAALDAVVRLMRQSQRDAVAADRARRAAAGGGQ